MLSNRRGVVAVASATLGAFLLLVWLRIDWDWSTIDDPGHVLLLQQAVATHGPIHGPASLAVQMFEGDRSWGLFRPSYWAYPSLFYWMPVELAHVIRLAMIVLVIAGPIAYFRRQGAVRSRLWMTALLSAAAASSLYIGLFFLSLQELSATAFVALGLLVKRDGPRTAMWTIAAWFKAPFSWLLIAHSVVLWRDGKRRLAVINAVLGFGTLALAVLMARNGSYTAGYGLDPFRFLGNLPRLIEPMNALLLVALVWWLAVTQSRLVLRRETLLFGIAFAGYTGQLLFWAVTGYYMGPISYFFGLVLVSMLADPPGMSWRRSGIALLVPAMVGAWLVWSPLMQGFEANTVVSDLRKCLTPLNHPVVGLTGSIPYLSGSEAAIRITQNIQLRNPEWVGYLESTNAGTTAEAGIALTHFVIVGEGSLPPGVQGMPVCKAGPATVYALSPED